MVVFSSIEKEDEENPSAIVNNLVAEVIKTNEEVNAEKISEMLCYWYESPEHVARLQQDFAMLHQTLKQAIYYLLRSENYEMLARSYNFFAIDAQSIDSLDVAYSYYASALKFTDADTSPSVAGIIISNIANFYYFIGDFKTARKYIRKGRSLLTKNNKDELVKELNKVEEKEQ